MSLQDRYSRVLLQSSASNQSEARKKRLRLANVRAQLRMASEFSATESAPSSLVMITPDMRKQLGSLGYEAADIKRMTPDVAQEVLDSGVTKEQQEKAAKRREKLFDALEDKVLQDLEALKHRLDLAKTRLEKAHSQVEKLDASLAEVEEKRDAESSPAEQEKLRKKSEWIQTHISRAEKAESSIRREIEGLEKLVSSITKTEDGLINELQEANDASVLTPGTKDDEIIEQLMKAKLSELDEISKLRHRLFSVQKTLDKKLEKLLRVQRDISQMVDAGGSRYEINTLREVADSLQSEADSSEKEQRSIIKEIIRHEDKLRDVQTESRLQELEETLKDLPPEAQDMNRLKEKSKEDIQQEDLGKEVASKPQKYKKRADEMRAYVDQVSQHYGDFILSFLAPDIPSDPKIDSFIRSANAAILKRAQDAKKLAEGYGRNPMHRSAILLVPSLYEFLASTMDGIVTPETKAAMVQDQELRFLREAFVEAGMVKEALDFQQLMDTSKSIGKGIGDAAKWTHQKGKQLGEGISNLVDKGQEALDRRKFLKEDEGPRRDPGKDLKKQQAALGHLQEIEHELKKRLQSAQDMQEKAQGDGDASAAKNARNLILRLQDQLKSVGERKDVLNKGLAHVPEPGIMKGQEQAARRSKTDFEQAIRLLDSNMPKLIGFVREGIPQDESLERELLRQSARIADAAQRMVQEGFKAKKKYPNLPPTIQAYGHMFLAIDDALHKALRSESKAA